MRVFVYRNNHQYGPYSTEQVKTWLSSGQVKPADLACYEGGKDWVPLSTIFGSGSYALASGSIGPRPSSGWPLIITGAVLTLIGVPLSAVIIGIPLVVVGIPMLVYGRVQYQRRVMWDLKESVRVGVVQGMPHSYTAPQYSDGEKQLSAQTRPRAIFCSECAAQLDEDARYCPACGTPTS